MFKRKGKKEKLPQQEKKIKTQAVDFEAMKDYMFTKSNKRAWTITWFFGGAWLLTLLALALIMPLKQTVPYLVGVDEKGKKEIITVINESQILANEALSKHDIYNYVKLREGYHWETLAHEYTLLQLFSSPNVVQDLQKIYNADSGRQVRLSSKYKVDVDVNSIILSQGYNNNIATVRASLKTYIAKNNELDKIDNIIITLTYNYDLKKKMLEKYRMENPLGFTVTSYRFDREL